MYYLNLKIMAIRVRCHAQLNGQAIDFTGDKMTPVQMPSRSASLRVVRSTTSRWPIEQVREFSDDFATMPEWFDASC